MSECFQDSFASREVYGEYFLKLLVMGVMMAYYTCQ